MITEAIGWHSNTFISATLVIIYSTQAPPRRMPGCFAVVPSLMLGLLIRRRSGRIRGRCNRKCCNVQWSRIQCNAEHSYVATRPSRSFPDNRNISISYFCIESLRDPFFWTHSLKCPDGSTALRSYCVLLVLGFLLSQVMWTLPCESSGGGGRECQMVWCLRYRCVHLTLQ